MLRAPRGFSTSARVHPSFLPHLRRSGRMPFRWLKPLAALSVAGFAAKTYVDGDGAHAASRQQAERDDAELRRRNDALMDVYGDRSSLDALEKAVEYYEKRR